MQDEAQAFVARWIAENIRPGPYPQEMDAEAEDAALELERAAAHAGIASDELRRVCGEPRSFLRDAMERTTAAEVDRLNQIVPDT